MKVKNTLGLRPGTDVKMVTANFFMQSGGLGDYINMVQSLLYAADTMPYLRGRVIVKRPFYDVAKYLFKDKVGWRVIDLDDRSFKLDDGSLIVAPKPNEQALNATGAHLMDLGYMYFLNIDKAPERDDFMRPIFYDGPWHWPELNPTSAYAVFTPGATVDVRAMPAKAFNELTAYTKALGVTPVFLGKRDFTATADQKQFAAYGAKFNSEYDFSCGIDLRERTTLLESVQIMRKARFVIGLDNGLLHFAGTTPTPIIFGHNVASIEHRKIRRQIGVTIDISVSPESLPCIGCQSKVRFIPGHRFSNCLYGDKACLDYLFANDCETWKRAIDRVLSYGRR